MAQYIDKSALVAEIERVSAYLDSFHEQRIIEKILSIIDTFETKEASSIWNDARKTIPEDSSNQIICIKEDDLAVATIGKLVNGTKKWAYLNDLLNISIVQVKEVDLEKEIGKYLDTNDIEFSHQIKLLDFAKHFFELGLKAKGE